MRDGVYENLQLVEILEATGDVPPTPLAINSLMQQYNDNVG